MDGGLTKIELAPWTAAFDPTTATWTEIPIIDTVEDGIQHPAAAELTVNNADGVARQTGKRSNMAIPITDFEAAYLSTLVQNARYVARLTYTGGPLLFGAQRGAVLRKGEPGGANFGGIGVLMLSLQGTAGATQANVTIPA